jgi:hypothetical protein
MSKNLSKSQWLWVERQQLKVRIEDGRLQRVMDETKEKILALKIPKN